MKIEHANRELDKFVVRDGVVQPRDTSEGGVSPENPGLQVKDATIVVSEAQNFLDKMIYTFQNDKTYADGYFIYLKQNPANLRNPYDLIEHKRVDAQQEGARDQSEEDERKELQQRHGSRSSERPPMKMNRADENLMSEAEGWAAKEQKAQTSAGEEAPRKSSSRPQVQPRSQPQESNDWKAQMRNFSNQAVSIKKRVAFKS